MNFSCRMILATALFATATFSLSAQNKPSDDASTGIQKFQQFYRYLNSMYIDTVHNGTLVEAAIRGVLDQLDPHSAYVSAEEMEGVRESFGGSFSGIGIEFNVLNDTIIVINTIPGGPSERVGLQPNDRIVEINGTSSVGTPRAQVPKLLRGPKGSEVTLSIVRRGESKPLGVRIIRDDIPLNTIDAAYKINPKTGYISINRFGEKTFEEFQKAMTDFGPIDALVLDLRNNPGGLMDPAVKIAGYFLPEGSEVVSTEGMRSPERVLRSTGKRAFNGRVIVLVNEASASSSEIVTGALQDWDRALVIGRRTFGKGLVQSQMPLPDGSAVRLTIARYHTPSGRVIQSPYQNGHKAQYYENFSKRIANNDTLGGDTSHLFRTLRNGRTVYGGGGILPDVIVAADTSAYSEYWRNLLGKGVFNDFTIRLMDTERNDMKAHYPTLEKFISDYTPDRQTLDRLAAAGVRQGVALDSAQFARSEPLIKTYLKALIAQKMWNDAAFYRVYNESDDPIYRKALDALTNWNRYAKGLSW